MSQTMKLVGSSCLFIFAVFCAVARSAEAANITVEGESCASNHPCGTHNESYFWCYTTDSGARIGRWDYCCKPDHPCGTHGINYNWCNNGYSWSYCYKEEVVTTYKTVSRATCYTDNPCGRHGFSYNWCYIPGGWDYCCEPDHACAKHGQPYDWCWVGIGSTCWQKCQAA